VTYALLWKVATNAGAGPKLATILVLLAALGGSNNWSHRPQLFTYGLFVWELLLLWNWNRGREKQTWWLVLIGLLWANLHGSFVIFFVLGGIAALFGNGNKKRLWTALFLAGAVTFLNPRGVTLWTSVLGTFIAPGSRNLSVEWAPPVNAGWQMGIFFSWLLLFALLAGLSSRRLPAFSWVWFLAFGWLALSGMRYVVWFLFLLVPLSAYLAKDWSARWIDRTVPVRWPALNLILGSFFVFLPLVALPGIRETWWPDAPPALFQGTPVDAINWLSAHEALPGETWSDIQFASYQIYALPSRPVWIDTRIQVVYPLERFDEYTAIATAAPGWQELLDQYEVNVVLLSPGSQPLLMTALEQTSGWCPVYEDDVSQIYARHPQSVACLR